MKTKKFLALLLAAVMAFACVFAGCSSDEDGDGEGKKEKNTAERALEQYIEALFVTFDAETFLDTNYTEYDLQNMGMKRAEKLESLEEEMEFYQENYESYYGENIKVEDFEVTDSFEYKKDDLKKISAYYNIEYGYPEDAIEGVEILECTYTIAGDNESESFEEVRVMLKVDGKWVVEYSADSMEGAKFVVESWIEYADENAD